MGKLAVRPLQIVGNLSRSGLFSKSMKNMFGGLHGLPHHYSGGTNPNQRGGMARTRSGRYGSIEDSNIVPLNAGSPSASVAAIEPVVRRQKRGRTSLTSLDLAVPSSARSTRGSPLSSALDLAVRGKRRVPAGLAIRPPQRRRQNRGGAHLDQVLKFFKLKRAGNKNTRYHNAVNGWYMHGPNAGKKMPGRKAQMARLALYNVWDDFKGKKGMYRDLYRKEVDKRIDAVHIRKGQLYPEFD